MMRVWNSRDNGWPRDSNRAAVWFELGGDRFMWILESGKHGVERDPDMLKRFDPEDWEEL